MDYKKAWKSLKAWTTVNFLVAKSGRVDLEASYYSTSESAITMLWSVKVVMEEIEKEIEEEENSEL